MESVTLQLVLMGNITRDQLRPVQVVEAAVLVSDLTNLIDSTVLLVKYSALSLLAARRNVIVQQRF